MAYYSTISIVKQIRHIKDLNIIKEEDLIHAFTCLDQKSQQLRRQIITALFDELERPKLKDFTIARKKEKVFLFVLLCFRV